VRSDHDVTGFRVLNQCSPGGTEENYKIYVLRWLVFWPEFRLEIS